MPKRKGPQDLVNDENSFAIDKCDFCGFVSYNPIASCPQCGNKILTGEIVDKDTWIKGAVKEDI